MKTAPQSPLPCVFFGHHKAATSWVVKIISDLAFLNGFTFETINNAGEFDEALAKRLRNGTTPFLAFRNADPAYLPRIGPLRGFHIVRDPRDIVLSSYFSHLNSHPTSNWPELATHQQQLRKLDIDRGLLADMDFCVEMHTQGFPVRPFACMRDWDYGRQDILEMKYEDVIVAPHETLLEIFGFLGVLRPDEIGMRTLAAHLLRILRARSFLGRRRTPVSLPSWNVLSTVYDNRFAKKAGGRTRGQEDENSHYRKGVAGDWKNHFKPYHKAHFKGLFGDLPVRLGYENTGDW